MSDAADSTERTIPCVVDEAGIRKPGKHESMLIDGRGGHGQREG